MQASEMVGDYYVRVDACVDKMKTLGEEVPNVDIVKKVLRTLLPRWNHVAIIIEESKDLSTLTYDQLIGSLMSHEERLQYSTQSSQNMKGLVAIEEESRKLARTICQRYTQLKFQN